MCGRFYIPPQAVDLAVRDLPPEDQAKVRSIVKDWVKEMNDYRKRRPRFNISPAQNYWVHNTERPDEMTWGFMRFFKRAKPLKEGETPKPKAVFNATRENIMGRFWADSFKKRRGIVMAGGFYEWRKEPGAKKGVPHAIELPDREPMILGCVWENDEQYGPCFSIVTTPGSPTMNGIHDRMPLILKPSQLEAWLTGKPVDALPLCEPYVGPLVIYPCAAPKDDAEPTPPKTTRGMF